jgi:hypothetical protein
MEGPTMNIEQRHVTTINLQDGKARDFVISRDTRGCKVSCSARDEVLNILLSYQDFQYLCQTVAQGNGHALSKESAPCAGSSAMPSESWSSVRVEQRHVTNVSLHPAKSRDFSLSKDDHGYKICSVSKEEVMTVLLSPHDFAKLRGQLCRWEWRETSHKETAMRSVFPTHSTLTTQTTAPVQMSAHLQPTNVAVETCEVSVPVNPAVPPIVPTNYPWRGIDWLGFN